MTRKTIRFWDHGNNPVDVAYEELNDGSVAALTSIDSLSDEAVEALTTSNQLSPETIAALTILNDLSADAKAALASLLTDQTDDLVLDLTASLQLPDLTLGAESMVKTLDADGKGSVDLATNTTIVGILPNGTTPVRVGLEAPEAAVANTFKKGFLVYASGIPTYFKVAKGGKTLHFLGANGQTVDILCPNV